MRITKYHINHKKEVIRYAQEHGVCAAEQKFEINNQTIYNWMRKSNKILSLSHNDLLNIRENKINATKLREKTKGKSRYYKCGQKWQKNNSEHKNLQKRERRKKYYSLREQELQKIRNKKHIFKTRANVTNSNCKNLGMVTAKDLWSIAKKQRLLCPISGIKLNNENMSVDHIIPISKGGLNIKSNIRLVHNWINKMRLHHTDDDFILMCKQIVDYQTKTGNDILSKS